MSDRAFSPKGVITAVSFRFSIIPAEHETSFAWSPENPQIDVKMWESVSSSSFDRFMRGLLLKTSTILPKFSFHASTWELLV